MRTDTFQLPSKKSVRKAGISLRDGVDDEKTRKIIYLSISFSEAIYDHSFCDFTL